MFGITLGQFRRIQILFGVVHAGKVRVQCPNGSTAKPIGVGQAAKKGPSQALYGGRRFAIAWQSKERMTSLEKGLP